MHRIRARYTPLAPPAPPPASRAARRVETRAPTGTAHRRTGRPPAWLRRTRPTVIVPRHPSPHAPRVRCSANSGVLAAPVPSDRRRRLLRRNLTLANQPRSIAIGAPRCLARPTKRDRPRAARATRGCSCGEGGGKEPIYFHHGIRPVRKSFSGHGERTALPSTSLQCASASESGAGPRTTLPVGSYCEPWHGHMYLRERRNTRAARGSAVRPGIRPRFRGVP